MRVSEWVNNGYRDRLVIGTLYACTPHSTLTPLVCTYTEFPLSSAKLEVEELERVMEGCEMVFSATLMCLWQNKIWHF